MWTEWAPDSDRRPEPEFDDRFLAEGLRAGDAVAFDRFTSSYLPALYRFAASRLRGDRELVREIVQTTVCKALAGLGNFRGEAAFFTWLCACCRNEIAMHYRRQSSLRREVPLPDDSEPNPIAGSPPLEGITESLLREERAGFVHLALDLLPPHQARALTMKYLENASVKQIAAALAISSKATESLLTRARIAFRGHYQRLTQDFEPSAMASPTPWGSSDDV